MKTKIQCSLFYIELKHFPTNKRNWRIWWYSTLLKWLRLIAWLCLRLQCRFVLFSEYAWFIFYLKIHVILSCIFAFSVVASNWMLFRNGHCQSRFARESQSVATMDWEEDCVDENSNKVSLCERWTEINISVD